MSADHQAKAWNGKYAGKAAFSKTSHGYLTGRIGETTASAQRVIWAMQTGDWPVGEVDHINGNRTDNRWCNLRDVSRKVNARNMAKRSTNTSGINGVAWHKRSGKWRAFIRVDHHQIHIGYYTEIADAQSARKSAEISYGFSDRHGT